MTVKNWTLLTIKECLCIEESGPFLDDVKTIHVSTINDPCFIMVNLFSLSLSVTVGSGGGLVRY